MGFNTQELVRLIAGELQGEVVDFTNQALLDYSTPM
jgi:hypothetical protein